MSQQVINIGENIPLNAQEDPKRPSYDTDPTARAVVADVTMHEERIPGMVKESTVWDVYNNEARKVDNELVKDWTASLNFLLVLAAIFAAVLSAFIIESKKMLEPDQTEILVNITIQYFNSMGNPSRANLTRPGFEPSSAAISINCCLFASLGASLVAALASVVSLQWVADYDAAITRGGSSPEDRAKHRQFRHAGVLRWKMGEIIAALPLLLYSSVILFWAGAIQWMWDLHQIVGYVVAGGTAIAVLFYASTTLLGAIYVSSPFRTPLSRGLYWLPRWPLSLLGHFLLWVPIESVLRFFTSPHRSLHDPLSSENTPASEAVVTWVREYLFIKDTYRHREDEAAKQDPAFQQEALAWLAEQLPISGDSYKRLCLFASGTLALPREITLSMRFLETPWLVVLEFLSAHHMQKILNHTTLEEDFEGLDVLLQLIDHPCVRTWVLPGPNYKQRPSQQIYWEQYPGRLHYSTVTHRRPCLASMTFLLARDIPMPSLGSKYELDATLRLIRWCNSAKVIDSTATNGIWSDTFSDIHHYSPRFFESCLRLFQKYLGIKYPSFDPPKPLRILSNIIQQEPSLTLTMEKAAPLAQFFAEAVVIGAPPSKAADNESLIPQPLLYGLALESSSQEVQAMHLAITLLVARAAKSVSEDKRPHWARWIVMMLWFGSPNVPGYWKRLRETMGGGVDRDVMDLLGGVDMTMGGLPSESPHLEEIITLLATLLGPLSISYPLGNLLWINSMDNDGKLSQMMRMLNAFGKLMGTKSEPKLHRSLVDILYRDMCLSHLRWPRPMLHSEGRASSSSNLDDHRRQVLDIQDPCLALMGGFACGVQPSIENIWTKSYLIEHKTCLPMLRRLVFRDNSLNDPPALWKFRAAMGPLSNSVIESFFWNPFYYPEKLASLTLLFQYPTECHSHSRGLQHLLLHLNHFANSYPLNGKTRDGQLNSRWDGLGVNPILAMLALSETQDLSHLDFRGKQPEPAEPIWAICKGVKSQPRERFGLILDIVKEPTRRHHHMANLVVILESIRQASAIPEDGMATPLLRPLAMALRVLLDQVLRLEGTLEQKEKMSEETYRICATLQARTTKTLIYSTSHLRILSCFRSSTVARSAVGWLKMQL